MLDGDNKCKFIPNDPCNMMRLEVEDIKIALWHINNRVLLNLRLIPYWLIGIVTIFVLHLIAMWFMLDHFLGS